MTVVVYTSADASAPTLSGTAGDFVNLLDKCLVAGYGSKAAAGWTKPYTGTNTAVFKMGGGNQFYLDVNDNGPGAAGAQEARVRGYETMTAVATGTNAFPTAVQLAAGIIFRKSAAASATTRTWVVLADNRTVYVFVQTGDTASLYLGFMFGDIYSYMVSDGYRTGIIGRVTENSATTTSAADLLGGITITKGAQNGHYIARSYTAFAGALAGLKYGDSSVNQTNMTGNLTFPHPPDGGLYISPLFFAESGAITRGSLRGLWHQLHAAASFSDRDTFTDAVTGRSFMLLKSSPSSGVWCVETSDTWDTAV